MSNWPADPLPPEAIAELSAAVGPKQNTKAIQEWEQRTGRVLPRPPQSASTWSVLSQGAK